MSDPVDTEVLRGVSERLAAVPIKGTMEQRMTAVRAGVELLSAADEVDRLRVLIENAPHSSACNCSVYRIEGVVQTVGCTCWKADAL